ncbi:MAG: hypothetical protein V4719_10150 [Planctomycetota bacterium]
MRRVIETVQLTEQTYVDRDGQSMVMSDGRWFSANIWRSWQVVVFVDGPFHFVIDVYAK